ncbi:MAG: hypothetical protein L6R45_10200 [Anaerolineae bacterium]|nr:hypothetical protein [Anaerolineae bacterium]
MGIKDSNDFAARVKYAAAYISDWPGYGTRGFDDCFEMFDGDAVAVAIYRRSLKNERLAANIWKALAQDSIMGQVEKYKDVPTRKLPELAARLRQKAHERIYGPGGVLGPSPES